MSRSLAYLSMTMLASSLPINSWALVTQTVSDERTQLVVAEAEEKTVEAPSCPNEQLSDAESSTANGAGASTEQAAAEAQAMTCCWVYMFGRWYCFPC